MKYSIIIPVYNAEKYLDECIESVLRQNADLELILVDDGSTDKSGEICERYKKDNVLVYHIENTGPGRARNFGVEKATGDFLMFMDADDYLSSDFFEKLENSETDFNADVILFEIIKTFQNGREELMSYGFLKEKLYKKSREDAYRHISECNKFPGSCWAKVINRKFYEQNQIRLDECINDEDIDWALLLFSKAKRFDFFDAGFYYYRINNSSRSTWGRLESAKDQLRILERWVDRITEFEFKKYFLSILAYQYAMIFPYFGALKKEEKSVCIDEMKKYSYLLKWGKTKKVKAIYIFSKIVGIKTASIILYKFLYMKQK